MQNMKLRTALDTDKLILLEKIFIIICFIIYFVWSISKQLGYGPDENMRYMLPQYIYANGRLPSGYDIINGSSWGFSYAFYPCFIGPILSSVFMQIAGLFTKNTFVLLVAARLTSVFAGTITVYFVMKISKLCFKGTGRWLMPLIIALLPQFAFISSYVNNDIICVCGSSIIIYSWCKVLKEGWGGKAALLMSAGIITVALSYYNGYGWILCSIIFFFITGSKVYQKDKKMFWKLAVFIAAVVLLFISYFFIRNAVLYHGDLLGMNTLTEAAEKYGIDELKPSNRLTPDNLGMSLGEMLKSTQWTGKTWFTMSYLSFIGVLGGLSVFMPPIIYTLYSVLFLIGGLGFALNLVSIVRLENKTERNKKNLFLILMIISTIIPIGLSLYYSYWVDYQAQGRYCFPMVVAFAFFIASGLFFVIKKVPQKLKKILVGGIAVMLAAINIYVLFWVYLS